MSNRYATLSPELKSIKAMMQQNDVLPPTQRHVEPTNKVHDVTEIPNRIAENNAFRQQFLEKQKAINLRNEKERIESLLAARRIPALREPHYQEHIKRLTDDFETASEAAGVGSGGGSTVVECDRCGRHVRKNYLARHKRSAICQRQPMV
jgi:hypothetical protein